MDRITASVCQGNHVRHLFLFEGNYSLDWRNRTGLDPKAGVLLSSAGIPLFSAPYCMVQQSKAGSNSRTLLESVELDLAHLGRREEACSLSLSCHRTANSERA